MQVITIHQLSNTLSLLILPHKKITVFFSLDKIFSVHVKFRIIFLILIVHYSTPISHIACFPNIVQLWSHDTKTILVKPLFSTRRLCSFHFILSDWRKPLFSRPLTSLLYLLLPAGNYCNRTWDGWLCWGDSSPGTVIQMCPEYFHDFDPAGEASGRPIQNKWTTSHFKVKFDYFVQQKKSPKFVILMDSGSTTQRATECGPTTPSVKSTPRTNSRWK